MISEITAVLFAHIDTVLALLWMLAIAVYLLKFAFPEWDSFTRFGKLETRNVWLRIPSVPNRFGWIVFYGFSCAMFFCTFWMRFPPMVPNFLLFAHSFRRLFECFFVTKFSNRKMHIVNLLAGLCFYFITPLTLAYCAHPAKCSFAFVVISLILNVLQFSAHFTISSLEKYSIPHGFLFNKITSPHYFIEILLYFVYFLSCPHILTFLMLFFVCLNLTHQAKMTYDWYCSQFEFEFTKLNRYVLIPYIY